MHLPQPPLIHKLLSICASLLALPAGGWYQTAAPGTVSITRGKALFTGSEALAGRIREHSDSMPSAVVICSNCHALDRKHRDKSFDAPDLTPGYLTVRRARRHGPPSSYDGDTFCRVLRRGVDPVNILVDHTMPVYQMSDSECYSIWRFLITR